jgi:hypothetical protein
VSLLSSWLRLSVPAAPTIDIRAGEMSSPLEKHNAVVACVVLNSGAVELPLLTKSNYHEWSLVMKVSLEAMELWDAVEVDCKDHAKDRRALAIILHAVPSEMKARLAVKKSEKEAWNAVKKMRVGDDRVKSTSMQRLLKELENVVFCDGESVGDFTLRINGLVASLHELGEEMEDNRAVKKILRVVPKKLKQVMVAIEMFTDFNSTSMEEVVGQLHVAEDADGDEVKEAAEGVGRLLLTEEQSKECRR